MLALEDLLEYAEKLDEQKKAKISLFFITRILKSGMTRNAKVLDKYNFELQQVSLSPDISEYFKGILSNQIKSHASRDEVELKEYTVIDDDLDDKIYTYALNNALSFANVINEQMKKDNIPLITNLSDIQSNLWAYCIKVRMGEEYTYSFRKISKSKVTTDQVQGVKQRFSALFDKTGGELKAFDGNIISFDDKIDCIYIDDRFYVFKKKSFESIVGLEEEFKIAATATINTIKECGIVDNLNIIEEMISHKPSILKTLSHIAEKGNHSNLCLTDVNKMNNILDKFKGKKFDISNDGKIILKTAEDARNFLKLLNDYYKQGMTTQKYYATEGGSIVNPTS
ncbi:Kiwa anti-phage protein KwaB-like domain-containing protein [Photobacterium sp. S4TG1]|uniref:Kiwa anti-phage protein KwaB-like domain-containing protein n=1 Tax=Photobacterium sp. S4TG1 TaxID=3114587 RepID=UPI002E17AF01|nr:Kiwa anti-phage protein KwaB-like domain-containing protein [Photobacterium sp. S4TG1]